MTLTNVEIFKKIDNKEILSEKEIKVLVHDNFEVDEIEGEEHRWYRIVSTIIERDNRYFRIDWHRGLTEYQENEYPNQPYEVEPKEKVITVKEWIKKEEN